MRKGIGVFVLSVFLMSFVVAVELMVVGEPGSFSGAVVKTRVADSSGDYGEKILPSEYKYCDAGVLKFDIPTSASSVDLWISLRKDGELVEEIEKEVNLINGTFMVDLRKSVVPMEVLNEIVNDSDGNLSVEVVNTTDGASEVLVTGKSIIDVGGSFKYFYIVVALLGVGFLIFLLVRMAYRSGAKYELESLGRMELDRRIDELDE